MDRWVNIIEIGYVDEWMGRLCQTSEARCANSNNRISHTTYQKVTEVMTRMDAKSKTLLYSNGE